MNRLNLDAFKTQAKETQSLDNLAGGILGACHYCTTCGASDGMSHDSKYHTTAENLYFWWTDAIVGNE